MNATIVINAYQRPDSLGRLLSSLQNAVIDAGTKIIFSLEYAAHKNVLKQATEYIWPYGEKIIIQQQEKLGLVGHFMFCGGLTAEYGNIVYLEDDLFVGRDFYQYTKAVLSQYENEEKLAGFSLNALWFNGYLHLPFRPVDDGNPCFFLQIPWYQGQVYTAKQWRHFKNWYDNYSGINHDLQMHAAFKNFKLADEWFAVKTQYLIETGKYYCFPRTAQCVNFGDAGTHFKNKTNFFQTELALQFKRTFFMHFDDCMAVYDSFYEILPSKLKALTPHLAQIDVETDLHGTKDISKVTAEYILTPVKPRTYIKKYAHEMRPQELNVVYDINGDDLYLAKTKDVTNASSTQELFYKQFHYYNRFRLTWKQKLKILFGK